MKLSHFMLLASVAAISLGACSSSAGPGEIGSKEDIIVRNHTSVPAPAAAAEPLLAEAEDGKIAVAEVDSAAGEEGMPVPRSPDEAQAMAEAAEPAIRENVEDAAKPMEHKAPMVSEAVPPSPEDITRAQVSAAEPEDAIVEANEPVVEQAAEEFQDEGVEQAAEKALAEPPVSPPEPAIEGGTANTPAATQPVTADVEVQAEPQAIAQPQPPVQQEVAPAAPAAAPAPVPAPAQAAAPEPEVIEPNSYPNRVSIRPTQEQLENYGMRVVEKEDGTMEAKPYAKSMAEGTAPVSAAQEAPQAAPAPVPTAQPSTPAEPAATIAPAVFNPNDPTFLRTLQKALTEKGYYQGEMTGQSSSELLNAVTRYQAENGLQIGGITAETARHLGLIK